jgi:hypothetical protein
MGKTYRPFATPCAFLEAFPSVADAVVEYEERGCFSQGTSEETRGGRQSNNDILGSLLCHNPRCKRGGFELQNRIAGMVAQWRDEQEFSATCPGDDGSPQGRRRGVPCGNRFNVQVRLRYKT